MSFKLFNKSIFHLHELEQRTTSPEELEAIRTVKIAFSFVLHVGEWYGFDEYLESIQLARTSGPLESFATREEADAWMEKQPEPPPPAVVAIGSELYSVGYNRRRAVRALIRIPTQQELDTGAP
jgi:hypothetical protein